MIDLSGAQRLLGLRPKLSARDLTELEFAWLRTNPTPLEQWLKDHASEQHPA